MSFIGLIVTCDQETGELVLAELSLYPFVAFEEHEDGISAYCEQKDWNEEEIKPVLSRYDVTYRFQEIEKVNWNEEWEKNYEPVMVGEDVIVRAAFHEPQPRFPYEIIVTPKMSFGTGHHATTHQVLAYQLKLDHSGKSVLDVGCGTGVLAIMAHKRGASLVKAIDIDDWCIENSRENFSLNNCEAVALEPGGIEMVSTAEKYDIILANINKNVLLEQMRMYEERMNPGGSLILSGFYQEDIPDLLEEASRYGLAYADKSEQNNWALLALTKAVS